MRSRDTSSSENMLLVLRVVGTFEEMAVGLGAVMALPSASYGTAPFLALFKFYLGFFL